MDVTVSVQTCLNSNRAMGTKRSKNCHEWYFVFCYAVLRMFLGTESQRREQMEEMDKKCVGRTADIVVHGLTQNNLKHVTLSLIHI